MEYIPKLWDTMRINVHTRTKVMENVEHDGKMYAKLANGMLMPWELIEVANGGGWIVHE